jgi:hypothetical protein
MKTRAARFLLLPVVLLALTLPACGSTGPMAAKVGDTTITPEETQKAAHFFEFYFPITSDLGHSSGPSTCGTIVDNSDDTQEAACERLALTSLIQTVAVEAYADEHDIQPEETGVQEWLQELEGDVGPEILANTMSDQQISREELEDFAYLQELFATVQDEVAKERLTDERVQELYDESLLNFTTVVSQRIVLETKAEADKVYQEMSQPGIGKEEFGDAARRYSIEEGSAARGGLVPRFPAAALTQGYGEAAAALEPGEVSEPVKTEFGWEVIRLIDKNVDPLDLVRDKVIEANAPAEFGTWLREELQDMGVEVDPAYGGWAWDTLSVLYDGPVTSPSTASDHVSPGPSDMGSPSTTT